MIEPSKLIHSDLLEALWQMIFFFSAGLTRVVYVRPHHLLSGPKALLSVLDFAVLCILSEFGGTGTGVGGSRYRESKALRSWPLLPTLPDILPL